MARLQERLQAIHWTHERVLLLCRGRMFYDTASGGYFSSSSNKWYSFDPRSNQFVEWPAADNATKEPLTAS